MPALDAKNSAPIGVVGLWHLGCVTAACLADAGHSVLGVDPDRTVVEGLLEGQPPIHEPGLSELLSGCAARLRFSTDPAVLAEASRAWITFDTPVDDDDNADVEWVMARSEELLAPLPSGALVVVSSQLPVGSVALLQARCAARRGAEDLRFACVPENLRLGSALDSFHAPDRIVVGIQSEEDREELAELLAPFCEHLEWMRVESAEMTKHALNSFLATSVTFINEVAAICESVGADAGEVSRGLKSERRIGPRAYLGPGESFAGGTLARDIGFLRGLAARHGLPDHLLAGVAEGNAAHRNWTRRKLLELLGSGDQAQPLAGVSVAIWGLTYKPGTDTLRRSSAIELCRWLAEVGALVRAHDPAVSALPSDLAGIELCSSALEATAGADVLVVSTAWPDYRELDGQALRSALKGKLVIDPAGALVDSLGSVAQLSYVRVGTPSTRRIQAPPMAEVRRG